MKKFIAILLSVLMILSITACGSKDDGPAYSAENPLVLKYSTHGTVTSDTGVWMRGWFDQIQEATEGRVIIEQYGSGILGSANEALSLLDSGAADIACISPAAFPTQFPCGNLVSLPMLPGFTSVM